ncbi:hypothetical protein CAPTEDRAFT_225290 [Capitella teleta]|uniref:heparosan-N-sulfate-glucuronate 5-epimerase n=1 Tax=Capitella teleta TaxID=283909 RepID=R7TXX8_CAPTE|nr:hypothetical protein CAPTEDRAFT_225290 [Capitella teleta]|eukprot:ELT98477.1 hypothetical protein CAPTEDRAFT_225290 [Capitella teleta]
MKSTAYRVVRRTQTSSSLFPLFPNTLRYVYGKLVQYDGFERFEWKHSYSRVYEPQGKYSPEGIFMSFEHYNVEFRDRVKCISGIEGVPLSTQWGPQGYFYPIQIAQYGLSHYSKYLVDEKRTVSVLEDAESRDTARWTVLDPMDSQVDNVWDADAGSRVISFNSLDSSSGVNLPVGSKLFFLSLDLRFISNASITVVLEAKGKQPQLFFVHYVCSNTLISADGNEVFYGIGDQRSHWQTLSRDLSTDLHKGLALNRGRSKKSRPSLMRVVSLSLSGRGRVDNITVSSNSHLPQFHAAADWLVRHQDSRGGWPIHVERVLANGRLQLPPGWYSGMAQGQAMSLLVRAYSHTRNQGYLNAALRATALFDVASGNGGVLAKFADNYPWYEEYPTTPSCFVLNGFIYALIGLYDLQHTVTDDRGADASRLYASGMRSLKAMLPLFDTGSGSIYDLRHFTLGVAPNLARWDYHTTHINQLLLLATIDSDPLLSETASRWAGYMKGHRAPHN